MKSCSLVIRPEASPRCSFPPFLPSGPTSLLPTADPVHLCSSKVNVMHLAGSKCPIEPAVMFGHYNKTSLTLLTPLMDQPLNCKGNGTQSCRTSQGWFHEHSGWAKTAIDQFLVIPPLYLFILKIYLFYFIYFWLLWVFVAARRLSLVVASGSYSSLRCTGFSLRWLLLLRSIGSRHTGFRSCGTRSQ